MGVKEPEKAPDPLSSNAQGIPAPSSAERNLNGTQKIGWFKTKAQYEIEGIEATATVHSTKYAAVYTEDWVLKQ